MRAGERAGGAAPWETRVPLMRRGVSTPSPHPTPLFTAPLPLRPRARRDYFYIVLELIEGGELFERIQKKDHYTERDARIIMRQMASAIATAHYRGICHRDLKPENVLLASRTDDTSLKIADLGFAKVVKGKNQLLTTPCGTPGYVAPEVISGNPSYTVACDVWSLGVILFILLCGCGGAARAPANSVRARPDPPPLPPLPPSAPPRIHTRARAQLPPLCL